MTSTSAHDFPRRGLYGITSDRQQPLAGLINDVEAAIRGGARIIQYRPKRRADAVRVEEAQALLRLCVAHDAIFIVNDDLDLALKVSAHGVHLGRDDGDYRDLRRRLGDRFIIGVSCYASLDLARQAQADGASYVAFGSFFPSPTKPHAPLCPVQILREARRELVLPIVAIGGITPENGRSLLQAGANFLAVINGLFAQPDIKLAAARYLSVINATEVIESHD